MTSDIKNVSVIICAYTYKRWEALGESIRSALSQVPPVQEVVLVVDHNPGLEAEAREAFPEAVVVANVGKQGLSEARNTGLEVAHGDVIVFLDDDASAEPGCVAAMVRHLQRPGIGGVSAKVIPKWDGERPAWFPESFLWVVGCSHMGDSPSEVRNLLGAGMGLPRFVFETVGGFDSDLGRTRSRLPMGGEETDLCMRASAAMDGLSFVYEPAAVVHHRVDPERVTWGYFTKRCLAEGLSKARLASRLTGENRLDVEQSYALKVLGEAFGRELPRALFRFDGGALQRFAATILGLTAAAVGFAGGSLGEAGSRLLSRIRGGFGNVTPPTPRRLHRIRLPNRQP